MPRLRRIRCEILGKAELAFEPRPERSCDHEWKGLFVLGNDPGAQNAVALINRLIASAGLAFHFTLSASLLSPTVAVLFADECLNANWFVNLTDAKAKIESWR